MPTGAEEVRFRGRTGSNQTTVEMTRVTQKRPYGGDWYCYN